MIVPCMTSFTSTLGWGYCCMPGIMQDSVHQACGGHYVFGTVEIIEEIVCLRQGEYLLKETIQSWTGHHAKICEGTLAMTLPGRRDSTFQSVAFHPMHVLLLRTGSLHILPKAFQCLLWALQNGDSKLF